MCIRDSASYSLIWMTNILLYFTKSQVLLVCKTYDDDDNDDEIAYLTVRKASLVYRTNLLEFDLLKVDNA